MRKTDRKLTALAKGFVLFAVVSLVGCGTGKIGAIVQPQNVDEAANVTIIRKPSIIGATNSLKIMLDDRDIFWIRNGQYTKLVIDSGEHKFGVACLGGWSPTWKKHSLTAKLEPRSKYYFVISPSGKCAKIEKIELGEGSRLEAETKYVPYR